MPRNRAGSYALQAALAALIVGVLAAFGGWLYTVRELNRLAPSLPVAAGRDPNGPRPAVSRASGQPLCAIARQDTS